MQIEPPAKDQELHIMHSVYGPKQDRTAAAPGTHFRIVQSMSSRFITCNRYVIFCEKAARRPTRIGGSAKDAVNKQGQNRTEERGQVAQCTHAKSPQQSGSICALCDLTPFVKGRSCAVVPVGIRTAGPVIAVSSGISPIPGIDSLQTGKHEISAVSKCFIS